MSYFSEVNVFLLSLDAVKGLSVSADHLSLEIRFVILILCFTNGQIKGLIQHPYS